MDNRYTEVTKDLQIIEDLFCETEEDYEKLFRQIDLSKEEFENIKSGQVEADKIQLENIYNFAYNHNLYLNEITWLDSEDEYKSGNISVNSHGAHTSIQGEIKLDNFAANNDFSFGFYLGEDISQAGMWVANDVNSSLYVFTFDKTGLQEARFNVSIDWMLAILLCRDRLDEKYINNPRIQEIKSRIDSCDYVYAPISDNNLFEVIDAFAAGEITDLQCLYAISATHLGYQVVIKTEKALQNIDMKKHLYFCSVEKSLYNKESDIESNTAMNKALIAKKRYSNVGKYIDELLSDTMNESIEQSSQVQQSISNGIEAREYKGFALLKWPNQRDVVIIDPITNAWCGMYKSMKEAKGLIDGTMPQLGSLLPPGENR